MPIDRRGGQKRPEKASVNIFCAREKVSNKGITGSAIHWVLGIGYIGYHQTQLQIMEHTFAKILYASQFVCQTLLSKCFGGLNEHWMIE